MKEVLFVMLDDFADHEDPLLAQSLQMAGRYVVKIVSPSLNPVKSIGGLRILPDYSFHTIPSDYSGLILIGGERWKGKDAEHLVPVIKHAIDNGICVGAICNAVSFMAAHGFLNNVRHTGNGIQALLSWGGAAYTNTDGYVRKQTISDKGIVTANGTGQLDFAKEVLLALENDTKVSFDVATFSAVDIEYARALEMGSRSVSIPTTEPWGQRTCYVSDPGGNHIEINSLVNWTGA